MSQMEKILEALKQHKTIHYVDSFSIVLTIVWDSFHECYRISSVDNNKKRATDCPIFALMAATQILDAVRVNENNWYIDLTIKG